MSWDVLIVGAGIAGLSAAAAAKKNGAERVAVLTNRPIGSGGCISKVHGINVGFSAKDQEAHFEETLASSKGLADPKLVEVLCSEIGERIRDLELHGLRFQTDGSGYSLGRYGGCDEPRALNCLDFTGRELANVLGRLALESGCWLIESSSIVSLLKRDGECVGVLAYDHEHMRLCAHFARAVILACGGGLSTVQPSTNPPEKYLAGISAAARAGAVLMDLELTQFHPTGLWRGSVGSSGEIIEEELRTLGGVLLNVDGERFAIKYSPLREMATRDVVARAISQEVHGGKGVDNQYVWLDLSAIDRALLARRFPYTVHRLRSLGYDLLDAPRLPVYPASHFILGGIRINEYAATHIPYLYACGEDAGGVHGANRLGGNGVADSLVFGHRAGAAAAGHAGRRLPADGYSDGRPGAISPDDLEFMRSLVIGKALGPIRSGHILRHTAGAVGELMNRTQYITRERFVDGGTLEVPDSGGVESWLRLQGLALMLASAEARTECIGPHYRDDYSVQQGNRQAHMLGHTITMCRDAESEVTWPSPLPPAPPA